MEPLGPDLERKDDRKVREKDHRGGDVAELEGDPEQVSGGLPQGDSDDLQNPEQQRQFREFAYYVTGRMLRNFEIGLPRH
jgi:hypothetical protein